jgi:hypothetical protein
MIKISIWTPVLLNEQIDGLALLLRMDAADLSALVDARKVIFTEDTGSSKKYDIVSMKTAQEAGIAEPLTGSEAVVWLCRKKGVVCEPLTEVFIPFRVYEEARDKKWLDISAFAANVARRTERLERLTTVNIPYIIAVNEKRLLREAVQSLENNAYGKRRKDGTVMRGLNDVGYSLLRGWDQALLDEWARQEAEFQEGLETTFENEED